MTLLTFIALLSDQFSNISPIFHHALPEYLIKDIEQVQQGALNIILPDSSYSLCLSTYDLDTMRSRREEQRLKLFNAISDNGIFLCLTAELAEKYALIVIFVCICVGVGGILAGVYILGVKVWVFHLASLSWVRILFYVLLYVIIVSGLINLVQVLHLLKRLQIDLLESNRSVKQLL